MKISRLGGLIAGILLFGSTTVLGAVPSINLQNNANNTVTVKVPDVQEDIYGIQLELLAKEPLTEEVVFEPKDKDAYSFTVKDGNKLTIYVTSNDLLDLEQEAVLGDLVGMRNEEFLDSASYRVVDYFFCSKDIASVVVEYTEGANDSSNPDDSNDSNDSNGSNGSSGAGGSGDSQNPSMPNTQFTDIQSHWATESIERIAELGILKGYEDGTFKPNKQITRAEFGAIVARAFGLKGSGAQLPFKDVVFDKWYTDSVVALYDKGIVEGRPDGTLGVNDVISNQEMAVIVSRTLKALTLELKVERDYEPFKDEQLISSFAKEAVQELYKVGLIHGTPNGMLNPKGGATRAQVAVIIDRALLKIKTQ